MTAKLTDDHVSLGAQRGFGRLVAIDFRDRKHLLKRPVKLPPSGVRYYYTSLALDQGSTPQCVAYAGEQYLLSGPITNKMYKTPAVFYKECQDEDEWPGTNYDGTSVRAAMKVLSREGYIESFQWAFTLEAAANHLLTIGPMVAGTNWYSSMMETDRNHFIRIHAGAQTVGGHAWMLKGINLTKPCPDGSKGAFRMINSWGRSWGQRGCAWISFVDFARLLRENGEAAASKERKFAYTKKMEESFIE